MDAAACNLPAMHEVDRGTLIAGKYELVEPIGSGGMASVWRGVTHGASGFTRPVAIKRVLPVLSHDDRFAAMFVEEARVVADLQHPNIVQIHDFDRDPEGSYFIVMELVEGLDMRRWIDTHARVRESTPWPLVCGVAIDVLRGLAFAHNRRTKDGRIAPVIHRDIAPSNILLSVTGVAKLADFGMARAMDRASMTKPGTLKGKLPYTAPELTYAAQANERSDLYGVGVVMWEALAGRQLFGRGSNTDLLARIRAGEIPAILELRPDLPEAVARIVHDALAVRPRDRFASADEMRLTLTQTLRAHPVEADASALSKNLCRPNR